MIKFSLSTSWLHVGGSRDIAPFILNLDSKWRWVFQLHAPAACLRDWSTVPVEQETAWVPELLMTFRRREKLTVLPGFLGRTSIPVCPWTVVFLWSKCCVIGCLIGTTVVSFFDASGWFRHGRKQPLNFTWASQLFQRISHCSPHNWVYWITVSNR